MRSRVQILRHPLHPMLVAVPTAIFPGLLVLDALHLWRGEASLWTAGLWLAGLGAVATLAAMLPGLVDFAAIPGGTRAKRTGLLHLVLGVATLAAYAAAAGARLPAGSVDRVPLGVALDVLGVLLVATQGWLGAELVYRHQIGVLTPPEGGEPASLERGEGAPGTERTRAGRGAPP